MSKTIYGSLTAGLIFCLAARAADTPGKFLGANSCASSSCHGGGGANQNQFLIWSLKDFHSQRPFATLATARAKQIAVAAGIMDPITDERCTACHTPLRDVPEDLRGSDFRISEGVSCESCHGPAGSWIRSHTRTDYTRAERTAAGMRALENLYVRANACVACHQVVAEPLLKAGHPELIFELDGQSVAEPKHWTVARNGIGPQAWFVGQAVALRETSWELAREKSPSENEMNRWGGLVWLLIRADKVDPDLPKPPDVTFRPNPENFELVQKWSDGLARAAAEISWTNTMTQTALLALSGTAADFREAVPQAVKARRAERLVLALDRLVMSLPQIRRSAPLNGALDRLFSDAQSLPDFKPADFAAHLEEFQKQVQLAAVDNRPARTTHLPWCQTAVRQDRKTIFQ